MAHIYMININDLNKIEEIKNTEYNDIHEKLYNLLESNKEELIENVPFKNGVRTLIIDKDKADKIVEGNEDEEIIKEYKEKLIAPANICSCCGTYSNFFKPDYRGNECLSKYRSCELCFELDDETYFKLMRNKNDHEILEVLNII